ncbi:S-adenosyl-L-methionine-dependent methyltransferase [Panus rudis PR-1116 ss-1]|nr:S-adenosyl-L-methionine-dependent methyltransferase [Panus rudis PR-1116 ss-1]
MSLRLSAHYIQEEHHRAEEEERGSDPSSSEEEDEDLTWDDWVSDSATKRPCKSLFDDTTFTSVEDVLNYDKTKFGFDLESICKKLSLDSYQRIRLINWLRKEKPTPEHVNALTGKEDFLASDDYLKPVLEEDPLLEVPDSDWSEDEEDITNEPAPEDLAAAKRRIEKLSRQLARAKQDLIDYRTMVSRKMNLPQLVSSLQEPSAGSSTHVSTPLRDDDSHYFQSYGENEIHAVMIQDKVRTATYATFIMTNPEVFRDAVVLDVGCGTGILSLFAARAGAKRVFAVDASDIAEKAKRIVKDNNLEGTITVIKGKVEDIKLPDDISKVDVIVSEWMGYALLYESMLDSVLNARDRFLKEDGIMAPSQCKMMLGISEANEIYKDRVGFWSDIYGFDLSAMAEDVYNDAIVDIVSAESMASDSVCVKDLYLKDITLKQLDFSSPFTLVSTAERKTKVHAFVLYFDTFFTATGEPVPEETKPYIVREGDPILAEVWQVGGRPHTSRRMSSGDPLKKPKPKMSSFSTGPLSVPTHWKQTIFLLREPIIVHEGTVVQGTFKCRKSEDNSRELDVEIHYTVKDEGEDAVASQAVVQVFKVR